MKIHVEQVEAMDAGARLDFHHELSAHLHTFSPGLCKTLTPGALLAIVREGVARAEAYGLTYRGPARLFLELTLLLGWGFDRDAQYPWAIETLSRDDFENQMFKAGRLEHLARTYVEAVQGSRGEHATRAMLALEALAERGEVQFYRPHLDRQILRAIDEVFPTKLAFVGEEAVKALVDRAERLSAEVFGGDDPRTVAILTILEVAFGMYFDTDPLYPWISTTLRDPRIRDPKHRAERLERRAIIWLRAVNASVRTA